MVRVVGVEPTRITSQEPKGYVTSVKDFKNPNIINEALLFRTSKYILAMIDQTYSKL